MTSGVSERIQTVMRIQEARYEMSDVASVRALQLKRLQRLLSRTWDTNEFYRSTFRAAGVTPEDVRSLADFASRVPTVSKPDFVADQQADPPFGRRHAHARALGVPMLVYTTSGTSGQGQEVHAQTAAELSKAGRLYSYMYRWAGLMEGDDFFLSQPITMLAGGRLEYHGAVAYGLTVYTIGNYDARQKIELMRRFRPKGLLANTSYLGRLGTLLDEEDTTFGVECLFSGAERGSLTFLSRLQDTWGARVFERYGSSQAGMDHMFTCERGIGDPSRPGMLHNIDPYVLVEVVNPATGRHVAEGEQGEVVITPLYKLDTPLIRCRMGDRAVFHEPRYCGCGRPFMGVEIASISRTDDMKKVKGVNLWPQTVDEIMFAIAEVDEYQVTLSSSLGGADIATIRVQPRKTLAPDQLATIRQRIASQLHRRTGITFDVEMLSPEELSIDEWKARRWEDQRAHVSEAQGA